MTAVKFAKGEDKERIEKTLSGFHGKFVPFKFRWPKGKPFPLAHSWRKGEKPNLPYDKMQVDHWDLYGIDRGKSV
jgi:hypothetical protein